MVSSVSPAAKTPATSYAERVKKAPPKTPTAAAAQRPPAAHLNSISTTSNTETASGRSPSKESSNVSSTDPTPSSSAAVTRSHTRASSPLSPSANPSPGKGLNGNSSPSIAEPSTSSGFIHAVSQKPAPVQNVWNVRMAAQAQNQTRNPVRSTAPNLKTQATSSQTSQPSTNTPRRPSDTGNTPPTKPPAVSQETRAGSGASNSSVAEILAQRPVQPPVTTPPTIEDRELWPEVGKSVSSTSVPSHQNTDSAGQVLKENGADANGEAGIQSSGSFFPRKNEKSKWVSTPGELQPAGEAAPRPQQNHEPQNRSSSSHTLLGTAAAGGSNPQSGRNSSSHSAMPSQTQSRTGSVHSSPKPESRGRRLLGEVTGSSGYVSPLPNTGSSSGTRSPRSFYPDVTPPSLMPYAPTSYPSGGVQGSGTNVIYNPIPHVATAPSQPNSTGLQFPHIHTGSPSVPTSPYDVLPSGPYGHPGHGPILPPPVHPGYVGSNTPPYPIYNPYGGYEFNQPYMYWNTPSPDNHRHPSVYVPPSGPLPSQVEYNVDHANQPSQAEGLSQPVLSNSSAPEESGCLAHINAYGPPNVASSASDFSAVESDAQNIRSKGVVFGSIDPQRVLRSPSPEPLRADENQPSAPTSVRSNQPDEKTEKPFTAFSIGFTPGEPGPSRLRSRTRSSKARARVDAKSTRSVSDITNVGPQTDVSTEENTLETVKIVDLTDPDTKWQFGSAEHTDVVEGAALVVDSEGTPVPTSRDPFINVGHSDGSTDSGTSDYPIQIHGQMQQSTSDPNIRPPVMPPILPIPSTEISLPPPATGESGDDLEVRDFGYGFGDASGTGYAATLVREERIARERDREREREIRHGQREIEYTQPPEREREFVGRPRRGSYNAGYERGGYSGRRGRGGYGGGRGYNSRGYYRGGYQSHPHQHQRQPSYPIDTSVQYQTLPRPAELANSMYPTSPQVQPYMPNVYDLYPTPQGVPPQTPVAQIPPPVPVPQSVLSFPLDPTRYYLLGQLEYYLSHQNMAQDFFLRQHMDSRGWISIPLLATFNRVRQLTMDVNIVRDVLNLSSILQVRDDWVRMLDWEQFVLPDAPPSTVESSSDLWGITTHPASGDRNNLPKREQIADVSEDGESEDIEGEEEEEEDVVFVMEGPQPVS